MAIEIVQGGAYRFSGNAVTGVRGRNRQPQETAAAPQTATSPQAGVNRTEIGQVIRNARNNTRPAENRNTGNAQTPELPERARTDRNTQSVLSSRTAEPEGNVQNTGTRLNAGENVNPRAEVRRTERLENRRLDTAAQDVQQGSRTYEMQLLNNFANRDVQLGTKVNITV